MAISGRENATINGQPNDIFSPGESVVPKCRSSIPQNDPQPDVHSHYVYTVNTV